MQKLPDSSHFYGKLDAPEASAITDSCAD